MQTVAAKPDPIHLALDIQAQRLLDAPGPTSWAKLVGDTGHVRVLAKELLENETLFRAKLMRWHAALGKAIVQAIREHLGITWRQSAAAAVTPQHKEQLRAIVAQHAGRAAVLSAAIEWQMHQRRSNAKAVLSY